MSHIRLRGIVDGTIWESHTMLRVGRLPSLEIVLNDDSVSRCHADIIATAKGWHVCDRGSASGTFINGGRLKAGEWPIRAQDTLRFGNVTMVVEILRGGRNWASQKPEAPKKARLGVREQRSYAVGEQRSDGVGRGNRHIRLRGLTGAIEDKVWTTAR